MNKVGLVLVALAATTAAAAPKKAKRAPAAVVIVVDHSGSMQGPRMEEARAAAKAAAKALAGTDDIAIISFDSEVTVDLPLTSAKKTKEITTAVDGILPGGGTNFLPALEAAYGELHASKRARRHVIFITDGEGPMQGIPELITKMKGEKMTITAVGMEGSDQTVLDALAIGATHYVPEPGKLAAVLVGDVKSSL
jgi:uncharacterized protein with von Willebrand factor type A (vWA) domain